MACFFAEESPVTDFLCKIIDAEGWTPSASRVFVPNFVMDAHPRIRKQMSCTFENTFYSARSNNYTKVQAINPAGNHSRHGEVVVQN